LSIFYELYYDARIHEHHEISILVRQLKTCS